MRRSPCLHLRTIGTVIALLLASRLLAGEAPGRESTASTTDRVSELLFATFDLETTGLFAEVHRPIQLGAMLFRIDPSGNPVVLDSFEALVDPGTTVPEVITRLTGISSKDVVGQPPLESVISRYLGFLGRANVLLGHNSPFDVAFLSVRLREMGIAPPTEPVFDSKALTRALFPEFRNVRLSALVEGMKLGGVQDHTAAKDALFTTRLFGRIVERAAERAGVPPGELTIGHLAAAAPPFTFAEIAGRLAPRPVEPERLRSLPTDFATEAECWNAELHRQGRPAALRDTAYEMGVDYELLLESYRARFERAHAR